ncbi:MAG: sulfatase-like hydrolase/transferase, partial [Limisphaerales bacterium]
MLKAYSTQLFSLLTALMFVGASVHPAVGRQAKPNIIFVLIDDMGFADLSCYGGKPGLTPHIDSLAAEGVRFTQFYVGAPICSPSRTAFLTGQSPARWRITSFLASRAENERRGMAQWLDPAAPTISRTFQEAGYATGHFGKWHLGGQRDVGDAPLITEYGFDESVTNFEGLGERILPLRDAFDGNPPKKYSLGSDKLGRGEIVWMDRSKNTEGFVTRTMDFIRKAEKESKPFYLNLWLDDVHS